MKSWVNSQTRLFWLSEDGPVYLCATVEHVSIETGEVVLECFLPHALNALDIKNGDTLEILGRTCGDSKEYDRDDAIIRMINCRIQDRYIRDLVTRASHDAGVITLTIELQADVIIIAPSEGDDETS